VSVLETETNDHHFWTDHFCFKTLEVPVGLSDASYGGVLEYSEYGVESTVDGNAGTVGRKIELAKWRQQLPYHNVASTSKTSGTPIIDCIETPFELARNWLLLINVSKHRIVNRTCVCADWPC
jgi:hypothetical protein